MLTRFRVYGVDKVTGAEREVQVEADSEEHALQSANSLGMYTSGARDIGYRSHEMSPERQRSVAKPNNSAAGLIVVVVVVFGLTFLVCAGIFNSSPSHNYTPTATVPPVQDSAPNSPAVRDAARKWGVSDDRMQHAIDQIQAAEDYRSKHNVPDPRNQP